MKVLLSLLLAAVLSPRAARTQQNPNTQFANQTLGLLTMNATDEDAKNCFLSFAEACDNANPPLPILTANVQPQANAYFNNATSNASVTLKSCLDNATDGFLKNVAVNMLATYLDIASNLAEFESLFSNECVQNASTISAIGENIIACAKTDCANYLGLLGNMDELLGLDVRAPRQDENQLCKGLKCVGLCGVKHQAVSCGEQFNKFYFRNYKLQQAVYLYTYLLKRTVKEDVITLPCRCKWFFK